MTAPTRRRLLGGIAAMAPASAMAVPPPAAAHPDAGTIALCAQHIANLAAYNAYPDDDQDEVARLRTAYEASYDALFDIPRPVTLDGRRAVARAAKAEAGANEGWENSGGGAWAWQLACDLLVGVPG